MDICELLESVYGIQAQQKNYKNSRLGRTYQSQFRVFFYVVELTLFLICNGYVLKRFDRFKSCWNVSDARKYILSKIIDLYFIDSWKIFGIIFWAPKLVYHPPKLFGCGPDCESGLRDGNKAFCLSLCKNDLAMFWNSDDRMYSNFFHPLAYFILAPYVNDPSFWVKMELVSWIK